MKIALWSNSRRAGVTGCTSALAVSSILSYGLRLTLLENQHGQKGLADCLFGYQRDKLFKEDGDYHATYDIRGNILRHLSDRYSDEEYDSINIGMLKNKLNYIWQESILDKESFDFDFCHRLYPLLSNAEKNSDLCLIDTTCNSISTQKILNEADMVAVILKQDFEAIDSFFQNFDSLRRKAVFILSGYQIINPTTTKLLIEKYKVPETKVSAIPYCRFFENAFLRGNITEYICANYLSVKSQQSFNFMKALKNTSQMLVSNAGIGNRILITRQRPITRFIGGSIQCG